MTKQIKLTQDKYAIVDDQDFKRVNRFKWHAHLDHCGKYYARSNAKTIQMHRFILGLTNRKLFVDHINGNGLDNRRCNLRIATNSQNQINTPPRNPTGYKGVRKYKNRWQARIWDNGRNRFIASCRSPEEAARLYNQEAYKLHGKFARLNDV